MHQQIFRNLSENLDYVKTYCNDRNNPLHFGIRKMLINQ